MSFDIRREIDRVHHEYHSFVKEMKIKEEKLVIVTLEGEDLIVEFTSSGLLVDGLKYETIENLMMLKSPQFSQKFHGELMNKLSKLQPNQ